MAERVRLQRFLAAAGVAARRKAEELITAGRVTVNGEVVRVLGTKIDPENDSVTVDGEAVAALDKFYVLLNKPKGCITAVTDDRGRPTVMDYLPNLPVPVKPVGRLDFYTEGVLLLTNDGELAARLLAPASHVPKTYHAKVHGRVTQDDVKRLRAGVELDDGMVTQPAEVALLPSESKHSWVAITIYEGKHHQIHRMLEALGFRVDKLQRVAFANLTFHHLRVGDARELTQQELNELRDTVGLDHSAVARGAWKAVREDTDIQRRARAKARAEAEEKQLQLDLGWAPDSEEDLERDDGGAWTEPHDERARREGGGSGEARGGRGEARGGGYREERGGRGEARGGRGEATGGGYGERRGEARGRRGGAPGGGFRKEQGDGGRGGRGGRGDSGRGEVRGGGDREGTARPRGFGDVRGDTRGGQQRGFGARGGKPGGFGGRSEARGGGKPGGFGGRSEARGGKPGGFGGRSEARGGGPKRGSGGPAKRGQGRSFGKRPR